MIQPSNFTKVNHDINGNPRHVCHFMHLDVHGWRSEFSVDERYQFAIALAKTIGGKKYRGKEYGGGIVFQEYDGCLPDLCALINKITHKDEAT